MDERKLRKMELPGYWAIREHEPASTASLALWVIWGLLLAALIAWDGGPYGLAAFVNTNDLNTSVRMYEGLEFGMVCVNDWLPATPEAPFGGIKQSGLGRESGLEGLEEYMESKTVFIGGVT